MKKRLAFLAITSISAFILSSCNHYYYAPNMPNVPLFTEEDQLRVSGAVSGGDDFSGAEIQAAYSLTPNIGVMANFISAKGGRNEPWKYSNYGDGYLAEAGVGYFKPISQNTTAEVYAGLGGGEVRNVYNHNNWSIFSYSRYFVQPAIGTTTKHFNIAFSTRIAYWQLHNLRSLTPLPEYRANVQFLSNNRSAVFIEPAVTVRAGLKNIKLQVQLVASDAFLNSEFPQQNLTATFGIIAMLDEVFKGKQRQ